MDGKVWRQGRWILFIYCFSSSKKLQTFTESPKNLPLEPPVGVEMAGLSVNKHLLAFSDAPQGLRPQLPLRAMLAVDGGGFSLGSSS